MLNTPVSAPGKLFLCGEYAVLDGAKAIITTVDRRAVASITNTNHLISPIVKAVSEHTRKFLESRIGSPIGALPRMKLNTKGFNDNNNKLGIGSSAAATASTCGLLFEWAGLSIDEYRQTILKTSLDAHFEIQGGKGSGADVAASVLGGTISFQSGLAPQSLPLPDVQLAFVWTGKSASTVELIGHINYFKQRDQVGYQDRMEQLTLLSEQMVTAFTNKKSEDIIQLAGEYGKTMKFLGEDAKAPIVTPELEMAASLASRCGGSAKPSGAGGGDGAIAFFPSQEHVNQYRILCAQNSLSVLDLKTHVPGLCASSCDPHAFVRD